MKLSPDLFAAIAARLPQRGDAADIGCGEGELLAFLAARGGLTLTGVEPDAARAARAAQTGARVLRASAEALPVGDAAFDAAVLECVFSLCAPQQAVGELARVLRPGGRAVVADLFAAGGSAALTHSPQLGRLERREAIEEWFARDFALEEFTDHTRELRNYFAQLLLEGAACGCVGADDLPALRAARPGYGLWIWTKR